MQFLRASVERPNVALLSPNPRKTSKSTFQTFCIMDFPLERLWTLNFTEPTVVQLSVAGWNIKDVKYANFSGLKRHKFNTPAQLKRSQTKILHSELFSTKYCVASVQWTDSATCIWTVKDTNWPTVQSLWPTTQPRFHYHTNDWNALPVVVPCTHLNDKHKPKQRIIQSSKKLKSLCISLHLKYSLKEQRLWRCRM